jgi:hypothetical protein
LGCVREDRMVAMCVRYTLVDPGPVVSGVGQRAFRNKGVLISWGLKDGKMMGQ